MTSDTTKLLRECDDHLTALDQAIGEKRDELKELRRSKEKTIQRMRDIIHSEQALPFGGEAKDDAEPTCCEHGVPIEDETCEACEALAQADTRKAIDAIKGKPS